MPSSNDTSVSQMGKEKDTIVQFQFSNEPKPLRTFVVQKSKQSPSLKRFMLKQTQNSIHIEMSGGVFQHLKCLRTLDLSCTAIEKLPDSIGDLKHLRYMGLRSTNLQHLPHSVCNLYNLQTLDLKHCEFLWELPRSIGNLINLRHLILPFLEGQHMCIPPGIGKLTNLQTLPIFYLKPDKFHCGIEELKELVNLRALHVAGPSNMDEEWGSLLKNAKNLQKMTFRCFSYDYGPCSYRDSTNLDNNDDKMQCNDIGLKQGDALQRTASQKLEAACDSENQPQINLREFVVEGYSGSRLPRWLGDPSLSKLATIRLEFCNDKCILLPSLGLLTSLKHLSVGGMQRLRRVGREFCGCGMVVGEGFQALETLEFTEMPEWVEWCGGDCEFPHLRELTLAVCPKLRMFDCLRFPSLVELKIYDCKKLTSIPRCPSLGSLMLWGQCNLAVWFPSLNLPLLCNLVVSNSQELRTLLLNQNCLSSLRMLRVENCRNLVTAIGLRHLDSLTSLQICSCPQFHVEEKLSPRVQVFLWPSEHRPSERKFASRSTMDDVSGTRTITYNQLSVGRDDKQPSLPGAMFHMTYMRTMMVEQWRLRNK